MNCHALTRYHCPLCYGIPTDKIKRSAIIFLDLDGVMVDRETHDNAIMATQHQLFGDCPTPLQNRVAAAYHLDKAAVESLKLLIEKIERVQPAYIVISSAWRQDATLDQIKNQMFNVPGLEFIKDRIVGKTPSPKIDTWAVKSDNYYQNQKKQSEIHFEDLANNKYGLSFNYRAGEIAFWLIFHKISDGNFMVIDDSCTEYLEHFEKRFIHVNMLSKCDVDIAMDAIFQWNKPSGCSEVCINYFNKFKITSLLPSRFMYYKGCISHTDKEVGKLIASHIAARTSKVMSKFLTIKGHLEKSIRPLFAGEPTEFPGQQEVLNFTEKTKSLLLGTLKNSLNKDKMIIEFIVEHLPVKILKELLASAGISETNYSQYNTYFPQGMKIKIKHDSYENGKGMFKYLMDFTTS